MRCKVCGIRIDLKAKFVLMKGVSVSMEVYCPKGHPNEIEHFELVKEKRVLVAKNVKDLELKRLSLRKLVK